MTTATNLTSQDMNKTEHTVAAIWAELLQKNTVTRDDNFFELGGDSMMAMIVQFQVLEKLGIELPPGILFESPTLGKFCELIEGVSDTSSVVNGTI